jgi:hypothetical protein
MKKEEGYVIIGILIAIAIIFLYYWGGSPTGFAVFDNYTNETDCVAAGYTWETLTEENCTIVTTCVNETSDCEPCLEYEDINGTPGDCIVWSSCPEEVCTDEETCVDVVVGGQCVGEVCDSNNSGLCLDETSCLDAGVYWYNETCNAEEEPSCANDVGLCLDENNCTAVGQGYWYNGICNENECESSAQCDSDYACSGGSCVAIQEEEDEEETSEETPVEPPEKETLETTPSTVAIISAGEIPALSVNSGDEQEIKWSSTNTGTAPLSSCSLRSLEGDFASWISFVEDSKNLNVGETKEFVFSVIVPEETEEGSYTLSISTKCFETNIAKEFSVEVIEKKLEFEVLSAERTREDRVRVLYSLTELIGEEQDVEVYFSILDQANNEIASASENQSIGANQTKDFRTNIQVNESLEGNMTLNVNFNSQIYSSSVSEPLTLGAPIGGFAIFGGIGTGGIIVLIVVVLALVFIFVTARIMRRQGKSMRDVSTWFTGKFRR